MPLEVSFEEVMGEEDVVNLIFRHGKSRRAARALIEFLKSRSGRCMHSEMNIFSHRLASGSMGFSLSRTNFYSTILHRLLGLGLIVERPQFDYEKQKGVKVYMAVHQPIPKRKPIGPSLPLLTHLISEKWNREFFS